MTPQDKITSFAQSVYLTKNNRYFDDITQEDGIAYIAQTIDMTNLLLDELERETDWVCVRDWDLELGTISSIGQTFELPDEVRKLVVDEYRPLAIIQDGTVISTWDVVEPNQITRRDNLNTNDRVTVVKRQIVFSRPFKDTEVGGTIVADAVEPLPRISLTDADLFDIFQPIQLLVLGVAKNSTLSDIVKGGLSPSFVQKYNDLLEKSVMENEMSSSSDQIIRDDYSYIGGI